MNNSKKGILVTVILAIILVSVLTAGIIKDKRLLAQNKLDYNNWLEESNEEKSTEVNNESKEEQPKNQEEQVQETVAKNTEESLNLYEKLKNKEAVRLLILGDGIALSQGRTSENGVWERGIASLITSNYGSEVEVKSLAKAGASSAVGYDIVNSNDISNFDLIIMCYGQNDNNTAVNTNQFKLNYENIVSKVKESNPNGTIIPILPNTLQIDNAYRNMIQQIAKDNSLEVADMKKAFTTSSIGEANLLNGTLPNDTGYQIYTQTLGEVIKKGMTE